MTILLIDELKRISRERGVEIKKKPPEKVGDWEKCQEAVNGFSSDIQAVIKRAFRKKRLLVSQSEKYVKYRVRIGEVHGFPVEFIAYESKGGSDAGMFKYAWYVAFDLENESCYKRDIIGNDDDQLYQLGKKIFS